MMTVMTLKRFLYLAMDSNVMKHDSNTLEVRKFQYTLIFLHETVTKFLTFIRKLSVH